MVENNSLSKLSEELENLTKILKISISKEKFTQDLAETLRDTIYSINFLFKNIVDSVESTIKDEEIKNETKEIITNISEELIITIKELSYKLSDIKMSKENLKTE
jgi:short-subunit dehydrogenase